MDWLNRCTHTHTHTHDVATKVVISPVNARDVESSIDHVAAQLVRVHFDGIYVGGDVYFAHNVEQEGFLDP